MTDNQIESFGMLKFVLYYDQSSSIEPMNDDTLSVFSSPTHDYDSEDRIRLEALRSLKICTLRGHLF